MMEVAARGAKERRRARRGRMAGSCTSGATRSGDPVAAAVAPTAAAARSGNREWMCSRSTDALSVGDALTSAGNEQPQLPQVECTPWINGNGLTKFYVGREQAETWLCPCSFPFRLLSKKAMKVTKIHSTNPCNNLIIATHMTCRAPPPHADTGQFDATVHQETHRLVQLPVVADVASLAHVSSAAAKQRAKTP